MAPSSQLLRPGLYYKGEKMDGHGPPLDTDFHGYGPDIRKRLSELIPADGSLRVLDVGTGMGSTSRFLLERLSKESRVWSLDPSEEVIAGANESFSAAEKRRVKFVRGTADHLKFRDGYFDDVVSVMVMHHIEALGASIAETARVLRRGGRLIMVDYSPEAHTLQFRSHHKREDFFTVATVSEAAAAAGLAPRAEDHGKWYAVEATKV